MMAFIKARLAAVVLLGLLTIAVMYQVVTTFVAYTWDAYVTSDIVRLSPLVPGQLGEVAVRDNQQVKAGDLLFAVDPRPYQIAVAKAQASLALAQADVAAAQESVVMAQANVDEAQARQTDAAARQDREASLLRTGSTPRQAADDADRDLAVADAELVAAQTALVNARRQVAVREAAVAVNAAELDRARFDLQMTRVSSPTDGTVAPFTARPGDFVKAGDQVLAVVSDADWRVVANLEEQYVHALTPGQPVYLRLAADPWTLHRGSVRTVARAVARAAELPGVVPFVPYATEWIRLQRRFPVEIDLGDLPKRRRLFAGADVSVLIFVEEGGQP
ncbi:MAG TPA: biotin/lipoyl-binding protein [Geminicoccus sp.]|jgi:multidrug efflux system membrane fusion protein|uniref:HlyD family secretion protein n=1 Tax=Geminicoccus sp. TaxID=2024832 RepID=UPI002E31679B|nr:biotin/lipoyl-binding protein [Geminicoccus sp.]HEX2525732.1 biotin/lipoyl-binding protein [Geminicoccus sp.]